MSKKNLKYICSNCSAHHPKLLGRCSNCGEFGTIEESIEEEEKVNFHVGYAGVSNEKIIKISDIEEKEFSRIDRTKIKSIYHHYN